MLLFHIDTSGNHARNIMAWTTECRKSYSTFLFPTKEVECKPCRLPKKKKKKQYNQLSKRGRGTGQDASGGDSEPGTVPCPPAVVIIAFRWRIPAL